MTKEERIQESARLIADMLEQSIDSGKPIEPNWRSSAIMEAYAHSVGEGYMTWLAVKELVARLRKENERLRRTQHGHAQVMAQVATDLLGDANCEIARLKAENERLRHHLKYFAEMLDVAGVKVEDAEGRPKTHVQWAEEIIRGTALSEKGE